MVNLFAHFNWTSTQTTHECIKQIVEENDLINSVSGIVAGRKHYQYLKMQDDIYDEIYCIQDILNKILTKELNEEKLEEYESRFGEPFLRDAIIADRKIKSYSNAKQKRIIQGWFEFYLDVFSKQGTEVYFTTSVDSAYTWIPFRIAKKEFGNAIQVIHTRIKNRATIVRNMYDKPEQIHRSFAEKQTNDYNEKAPKQAKEFLSDFRTDGLKPGYSMRSDGTSIVDKLLTVIKYIYDYHTGFKKDDFYYDPPIRRLISESVKNVRGSLLNNHNVSKHLFRESIPKGSYVYYPLHLQPEATTNVLTPLYTHQKDVIRAISKSIPINHLLCVKEHPRMVGRREVSYYRELLEIPNVALVSPSIDSHELIKKSNLVITLTGTGGFEAVMYKKPAIVLGEPHYSILSTVSKANGFGDLCEKINNRITDHNHDEQELIDYISAIFENSFEYHLGNIDGKQRMSAIDGFVQEFKRELEQA